MVAGAQQGAARQTQPPATSVAAREFARGIALHREGKLEEAYRSYARALELDPGHVDALNNMGVVLRAQGRIDAALAAYERGLALRPDDPGLLANLGSTLRAMGQHRKAVEVLHRAIALAPKAPGVHNNLGLVLRDLGHYEEALACFERSLEIWPNNLAVKLDRALTLLAKGDYPEGFRALEARFEGDSGDTLVSGLPIWNGAHLRGRTLLVRAEQGVAEVLQFCRFVPLLQAAGGHLVLECQPALLPLLRSLEGIDEIAAFDEHESAVDVQLPLLSVPRVVRVRPQDLPAKTAYLKAPERAGFVLMHPAKSRLSLGLIWGAQPEDGSRPAGSLTGPGLTPFFRLMRRPDVAVYALQRGESAREVKQLGASGLLHDLSSFLTGLEDLARLMEQVDLIITADSTAAHLAGALGRPVWLILPRDADWRWALAPDTTPWYPTMRLFRQPQSGDWPTIFEAVAEALDQFAEAPR
ncbi:MAG: tetratricopeptide repeat protein [Kiloniellales bacterium]